LTDYNVKLLCVKLCKYYEDKDKYYYKNFILNDYSKNTKRYFKVRFLGDTQ